DVGPAGPDVISRLKAARAPRAPAPTGRGGQEDWVDWQVRAWTLLVPLFEEACRIGRFVLHTEPSIRFPSLPALARARRRQRSSGGASGSWRRASVLSSEGPAGASSGHSDPAPMPSPIPPPPRMPQRYASPSAEAEPPLVVGDEVDPQDVEDVVEE